MTRTIVEDNPSRVEIHQVDEDQVLVIRKQVGQDDDWLGRIVHRRGTHFARAEFNGAGTDLVRHFELEEEAIQWLCGLKPTERSAAYQRCRQQQRAIYRERWAKDRRENPQWYNPDGSHIGINSDGSFRSSYRNTR